MKLKVWLNSGANCDSTLERIVDLKEELGMSDETWNALPEYKKEIIAQELAFEKADWGYLEIVD